MDSPRTYSSDESDGHHPLLAESLLAQKKREIVARSMAMVGLWLDKTLGSKRARDEDSSAEDDDDGEPEHRSRGTARKKQCSTARANPRRKDGLKKTEALVASDSERRFACPYHQHNPAKYKSVKTCMGPGWDEVHRMKEHLYRSHAIPKYYCDRCHQSFENAGELRAHVRADQRCAISHEDISDKFDYELEKKLRVRSKNGLSEEQKWIDAYKLLFPGEAVPSPYYDDGPPPTVQSMSQDMQQLQDKEEINNYLRREFPKVAQRLIEEELDKQIRMVTENMMAKSIEICQDIQTQLVRTWTFHKEQSRGVGNAVDTKAMSPGSEVLGPNISNILDLAALDAIAEPFFNFGDTFPYDDFLRLDGGGGSKVTADSAYYTLSEECQESRIGPPL